MERLSDCEIVEEIAKRLKEKDRAYHDLKMVGKKLEAMNRRLLESEKLKGHFLSNIKNEINNPLTSVLTMCELIASGSAAADFEAMKSAVNVIYKEAFSLNFQLRNIFAAAELEAGDAALNASCIDMDALLGSTVASFQQRAADKGLTVTLAVREDLRKEPFRTDPEKLQCVLSNLIANAIEYSFEGMTVEIKAWKEGGGLFIRVKDYGIGMDETDLGVIFERFRQLDSGVSKRHGGHGLGLSVAKASIELLNGRITVASRKGDGAEFTVIVPEAGDASAPGAFTESGNDFFFTGPAEAEKF